jgi:hypothetical protein
VWKLLLSLLLGTIAALTFAGSVQAQRIFSPMSSDDVFAAYCIGVFEIHTAHTLLYEDKVRGSIQSGIAIGCRSSQNLPRPWTH